VFRNVVVHPTRAYAAALASCAAHKQKKFDLMEDKLWEAYRQRQFDTHDVDLGNGPQKCWETPDGCPIVVGFAKDLGLRPIAKTDMAACKAIVDADMQEMQRTFAVSGTPAFFINGRYLSGAQPTASYEAVIDDELAKANTRVKGGTPKARYYKTWVIDKGEKRVDVAQPMPPRQPRMGPDPALTYAVPADGYPSRGPADAKVTIIFFFDYASPYAERTRPVIDELIKKHGADLRIVYRTRLVHPANAMAGALAMCAAAKQNRFAVMDDAIWERASRTARGTSPRSTSATARRSAGTRPTVART
jgi:protein-disulfide isomerase